jgi:AhpD family alkylhydroperoxidase
LSKHFAKVGLTGIEMQTVLVVSSVENACAYCVAAHSTFATNMKIDQAVLKALRQGTEPPDAKLNALATFVRTLIRTKGNVSDAGLNRFIAAGYTREQGLGSLIGAAMKTIGNLANHFMKTPFGPAVRRAAMGKIELTQDGCWTQPEAGWFVDLKTA